MAFLGFLVWFKSPSLHWICTKIQTFLIFFWLLTRMTLSELTAAFETVDHSVLTWCLEHYIGIKGTALEWFRSHISFSVRLSYWILHRVTLLCRVSEGSILKQVQFFLYMLLLGPILSKYGISLYCYADDIQIYLTFETERCMILKTIFFFNFNKRKAKDLIFGPSGACDAPYIVMHSLSSFVKTHHKEFDC